MGKFNLKFVKPVASLAIGAAVLTGSFAVTGATDTAFAKAATVKVSKGKLVTAKTGKVVKGYKTYKSVLYKDGKKFSGVYKNTYYKTGKKATALYKGTYYKSGKKGTGLYKNVYYKNGKKGDGFYGTGSAKKWYQDGKLLTGLGKNSGKYYIKGKLANGILTYKGVEKLYKDGKVVETTVDAAKAINNTTVEVTFASAQKASDISAGRFVIEGLEVTNAAVKQSDDKVIVLTTAAQTGGKTYTVALDGVKSRTFKGVSNVQPTAITNLTPSLQGVIGTQVTVKTQVEVPAGSSKEGIAVTFNITNSADTSLGNFGKRITAEVFTDANGVASYSYTQYAAGTDDTVEAYPTGNASVKATAAKVYWGNTARLTLTEVTTGNALANGSKKVYKVKAQDFSTKYTDATQKTVDYKYVNVAFAENLNVTPDKLVRGATIEDAGVVGNDSYPSQVTTGGVNKVQVKLDANGEATFTVTGSNAAVTPIVFVDAGTKGDKLDATELQAKAPTVTFALSHTLGLAVKAEGVQNAAATNVGNVNNKGTGEGGRKYTVTVTDKDGKVAPAGTKAYVTFAEGSYSTDKKAYILNGKTRNEVKKAYTQEIEVKGTKGEATFTLVGQHDAFAAPTVFLENGKEVGLDKADLQTVGETTYFVNAVINNAELSVEDVDGKGVTTLPTTKTAYFNYNSVDQNGFEYYAGNGIFEVSYQVTANFADVTVSGTFGSKKVYKGTTETVKVNASAGQAVLKVDSELSVGSNVTVNASASQVSLPNKTASIAFTKGTELPAVYTGVVASFDTNAKTITFAGKDAVKYAGETGKTYVFKTATNATADEATFLAELRKGSVKATYEVKDNVVTFYILEITAGTPTEDTVAEALKAAITNANLELGKVTAAQTAYVTAGGKTDAAVYTEVTTAKTELDKLAAGTDTAKIKAATITLTTKLTALTDATSTLNSATAKEAAKDKLAKAVVAKTEADKAVTTAEAAKVEADKAVATAEAAKVEADKTTDDVAKAAAEKAVDEAKAAAVVATKAVDDAKAAAVVATKAVADAQVEYDTFK